MIFARNRFVEDDLFAVIIDENGNESESEEELSDSEENQNNKDPQNLLRKMKMEVTTHPGKGSRPLLLPFNFCSRRSGSSRVQQRR